MGDTEALPDGENEWSVLGEQGENTTGNRNGLIADIMGMGATSGCVSRKSMPPIDVVDSHRWRHEWRKSKASKPRLWGNEKEK